MRLPSATALTLQPADASRERLQTAARELESQFAQMMLKSMRSTSLGDSMMGDNSTYRDMYDQQLAKEITKGRGLGLAPMIEHQLSRNLPAAPAPVAAGPMALDTVLRHGPISLMQNLPLAMPLSADTTPGGYGLPVGGLALAPPHAGAAMPAVAPLPAPAPPP